MDAPKGPDPEDNLSQALEYRNSLRRSLFEEEEDGLQLAPRRAAWAGRVLLTMKSCCRKCLAGLLLMVLALVYPNKFLGMKTMIGMWEEGLKKDFLVQVVKKELWEEGLLVVVMVMWVVHRLRVVACYKTPVQGVMVEAK
ncbi:hypothetical protein PR202_gb07584 [Eleusine coracana subsp. coracana]|uniref:Uncharacterized protein n=1 Tax=Eleusine coracana subsp. coracana TaxID=191504 RepID=A0AAV5ECF4_ELECO|nr:hypothetical protein PR202_gb07584 [Eleusine coracana subsp. coracana]